MRISFAWRNPNFHFDESVLQSILLDPLDELNILSEHHLLELRSKATIVHINEVEWESDSDKPMRVEHLGYHKVGIVQHNSQNVPFA